MTDGVIDRIFEEFDDLYNRGQFTEADLRLANLDMDTLGSYAVVGYLIVARWPEIVDGRILPCRRALIERGIQRLRDLGKTEEEIGQLVNGCRIKGDR